MLEFKPFPKLSRLRRGCIITEKIDGTNAQIQFSAAGDILVGSRKREIFPEGTVNNPDKPGTALKGTDNFAFAQWAYANKDQLFDFLGAGCHYGEWAGQGIQRGYGLDHKRFFLFNTGRFGPGRQEIPSELAAIGLDVVPTLLADDFSTYAVDDCMEHLRNEGSCINGFDNPEGVVVYHTALQAYFKVTFEHDGGKWRVGEDVV